MSRINLLVIGAIVVVLASVSIFSVLYSKRDEQLSHPNNHGKAIAVTAVEQKKIETTIVSVSQDSTGELVMVSKNGPTGTYYGTHVKEVSPGHYEPLDEPKEIKD
jgi:hypothetical protein